MSPSVSPLRMLRFRLDMKSKNSLPLGFTTESLLDLVEFSGKLEIVEKASVSAGGSSSKLKLRSPVLALKSPRTSFSPRSVFSATRSIMDSSVDWVVQLDEEQRSLDELSALLRHASN